MLHRVVRLQRFEARQPEPLGDAERFDDLPRSPVRHADVAHVAVPHQLIERANGFFDRRGRVEAVIFWYRSMWSSCSRFRLALTPSRMWLRVAPRAFGPAPVSPKTLATTTLSRGTFRFFSAWPVICSERPPAYTFGNEEGGAAQWLVAHGWSSPQEVVVRKHRAWRLIVATRISVGAWGIATGLPAAADCAGWFCFNPAS